MFQRKLKIAHFLSSRLETLAGGDLVILNSIKYLDKEKFESSIVCFHRSRYSGIPLIIKIAQERAINTHMIEVKDRFDLSAVSKMRKFLRTEKIDILHCHGYKADVIASLIPKNIRPKTVTTLHGWWIGSNPKLKFYDWLDIRAMKNFDKIITVAEHIKTELIRRGFSEENIAFIPNGVDLKEMASCDGTKVRNELNIQPISTIVGIAGRLNKEKGHEYLLRSIVKLPEVVLLIVGTGPLEKKLMSLADELNIRKRTIFTGFKNNPGNYIAAMDIFVLPSLSEGLPLALLEAMAAGKPVIASKTGGIPKVVDGKNTGLLVEPKNVHELKNAILKLINDKKFAASLAKNGKSYVENHYSLAVTTKKYEELYTSLLKER